MNAWPWRPLVASLAAEEVGGSTELAAPLAQVGAQETVARPPPVGQSRLGAPPVGTAAVRPAARTGARGPAQAARSLLAAQSRPAGPQVAGAGRRAAARRAALAGRTRLRHKALVAGPVARVALVQEVEGHPSPAEALARVGAAPAGPQVLGAPQAVRRETPMAEPQVSSPVLTCGIVDGITATFDAKSKLPYDTPTTASAGVSRPSIVMPAYYDLWHQATEDPFWSQAAAAARAYWQASAHPTTGLMPDKATFDGTPVPDFDNFDSECLRIFFNMALDYTWSGSQPWLVEEGNRLLQFFYGQGLTSYGLVFSLDGNTIKSIHDRSLMAANGALALVATSDIRRDFVNEVWNLGPPPTGATRYYPGITQLMAFVMLSGQMRVY